MENIPPPNNTLFQYRPPREWAFENLCERVLYCNPSAEFNDPYDFLAPPSLRNMTDEEFEYLRAVFPRLSGEPPIVGESKEDFVRRYNKVFEANEKVFRKTLGFACFSERKDNLLMWSHYGGGGKGFCLEFDPRHKPFHNDEDDALVPVQYRKRLLEAADTVNFLKARERNAKMRFDPNFAHKAEEWKYEEEWRLVKEITNDRETRKIPYDAETLKGIYFGVVATETTIRIVRAIVKDVCPATKLYKMHLNEDEYKLEFGEISS